MLTQLLQPKNVIKTRLAATGARSNPRMPSAAVIKQRVRDICQSSDLNTLTEKAVRQQLAQEFGQPEDTPGNPLSKLIKNAIDDFLDEIADDDAYQPTEDHEEEAPKKTSKKRAAGGGGSDGQSAKQPRLEGKDYVVPLPGGNKRLTVSTFKGKVRIDLREFYTDANGDEKPGAKGISLTYPEWLTLSQQLPALMKALEQEDHDFRLPLADLRAAYLSTFKGSTSVHVREFYADAEGQQQPTKKGISLNEAALTTLHAAADAVSAHARKLGATDTPAPAAGVSTARDAPAAGTDKQNKAAAGRSAGAQPAGGQAAGCIDLGNMKFVKLSDFQGGKWVDLREYYSKGSEVLPGKKGILLKYDEWHKLAANVQAISDALAAKDLGFSLQLAPKRKVGLSTFKSTLYVGVREYYVNAAGQEQPGAKGLSMNAEQWNKLAAGAAAFTAALP